METPAWLADGLVVLDAESTGSDPERDRIVSAALLHLDCRGSVESRAEWLVNPGIEIPDTATGIHGISTAQARDHGRAPAQALTEIAAEIRDASDHHLPVVIFNAPFDLTLIDRDLRRHTGNTLAPPARVLDPLLIDRAFSDRPGRRRLRDCCAYYGIEHTQAHAAGPDALAAGRLLLHQVTSYPELAATMLPVLQAVQPTWYRIWSSERRNSLIKQGRDAEARQLHGCWPMVPFTGTNPEMALRVPALQEG